MRCMGSGCDAWPLSYGVNVGTDRCSKEAGSMLSAELGLGRGNGSTACAGWLLRVAERSQHSQVAHTHARAHVFGLSLYGRYGVRRV